MEKEGFISFRHNEVRIVTLWILQQCYIKVNIITIGNKAFDLNRQTYREAGTDWNTNLWVTMLLNYQKDGNKTLLGKNLERRSSFHSIIFLQRLGKWISKPRNSWLHGPWATIAKGCIKAHRSEWMQRDLWRDMHAQDKIMVAGGRKEGWKLLLLLPRQLFLLLLLSLLLLPLLTAIINITMLV